MTKNREEWLHDAAREVLRQFPHVFEENFGAEGKSHLESLRISAGFPSVQGANGRRIGECWTDKASKDKSHHIFISPLLEDPVKVVATLAHELVHAADNGEHHHKGPFVKAVRALGLEGKPTATVAGEEFANWVRDDVLDVLGPYPHVALEPTLKTKTQKTYMQRVECPDCGCIVRMTEKWIDDAGLPTCGCGAKMEWTE